MSVRRVYSVLFLCTGNSARSIMAECSLSRWSGGRFQAFSAGSRPAGYVHPLALEFLKGMNFATENLRSKSWDEFARADSPPLDFVFTVCDKAAGESCPVWPGQPVTAHWGVEDPAAFIGSQDKQRAFFRKIFLELDARIRIFVSLKLDDLDEMALQRRLNEIGLTEVRSHGSVAS